MKHVLLARSLVHLSVKDRNIPTYRYVTILYKGPHHVLSKAPKKQQLK